MTTIRVYYTNYAPDHYDTTYIDRVVFKPTGNAELDRALMLLIAGRADGSELSHPDFNWVFYCDAGGWHRSPAESCERMYRLSKCHYRDFEL